MRFVVLLNHQNGKAVPVLAEDEYTMREFWSYDEADAFGKHSRFGGTFGYHALPWPRDEATL